jgi:hypothetical protein
MTEQTRSANGTVAEEAVRLIEAMASMARSTASADEDASSYADPSAKETAPGAAHEASPGPEDREEPLKGACSACGGERDSTPFACKLCPVCQGIALIRSIRPETVDRLADFAAAVASSLRDMAAQSRGSGPGPGAGPRPGSSSDRGRPTVQDIHVGDEG